MVKSDVITLVSVEYHKNKYGVDQKETVKRDVFAEIGSVTGKEFFAAAQTGIKPVVRATIFSFDYNDEQTVIYNGTDYTVYRTYQGKNDNIELYLQKRIG